MSEEINKAENSVKPITSRPPTKEIGNMGIVTGSRFIQDLKRKELRMENRVCTFSQMMEDDAVANSVDVTNIQVISALNEGQFVPRSKSSRSKAAAEFLNYCIRNMRVGTWLEAMNSAATDLTYGFSIQNIVVRRETQGRYKGFLVLDKLSPRHQSSVYGWVFNKNNTELRGVVQKPMLEKMREPTMKQYQQSISYDDISSGYYHSSKYPFISTEQMLLFRHNPTDFNPQGNSPLVACYDPWVEKKLIEHYEVVGVSKDMAGIVVLRVPSELIEQANDPTRYPEAAKEYAALQEDAANLQNSKTSSIVLVSDSDEISKKYLYDMELKGIEGGGKMYSTEDLINQRRKAIYNNFGAQFLLLGQNGHGSNALAGAQMTTHDYYIKRCIDWKVDVLVHQLARRLLAVNGEKLDWKDFPIFEPSDPSKPDWDSLSKVLQRSGSVELLTDAAIADIYETAGWSLDGLEEHLEERKQMKIESNAGKSQGSSGTGNTQAGGISSTLNAENKSTESFVVDYETATEVVAVNTETGKPIFISKEVN